jgi:hypothetical protein
MNFHSDFLHSFSKRFFLLCFFLGVCIISPAQVPSCQWGNFFDGNGSEFSGGIAVDSAGYSIVAGRYVGNSLFQNSLSVANTNSNTSDIFLAKFDPSGQIQWLKGGGGGGDDYVYDIAVDDSGNIYMAGFTTSTSLLFGTILAANPSIGSVETYVAKFASNGVAIWVRFAGGAGIQEAMEMKYDRYSGKFVVAGLFSSDSMTVGSNVIHNGGSLGSNEIFIFQVDCNGNFTWAKSAGGIGDDRLGGIAIDANSNIIMVGTYDSPVFMIDTFLLNSAGQYDVFISKFDQYGNVSWLKREGGTGVESARCVVTDSNNDIWVAGEFSGNPVNIANSNLTNAGGDDVFISKYHTNGSAVFARSSGGDGNDYPECIAIDRNNAAIVAGRFTGQTFANGTTTLQNTSTSSFYHEDMFVEKISVAGTLPYTVGFSGANYEIPYKIISDNAGDIFITGIANSDIGFGTCSISAPNLGHDIFIIKLHDLFALPAIDNLVIYPSPSSGEFNFSSSELVHCIRVFDVAGRLVETLYPEANSGQLFISCSGMYFLDVIVDSGHETKKIVVAKKH